MDLTAEGFGALAAEILSMAEKHCHGRALFALEGGYNLAGLREGVKQVLLQMNGTAPPPSIQADAGPVTLKELAPAVAHLSGFWKLNIGV